MSSSRRTAAASPTQRSLTLDAAAPLLHAARTTFGAQPQLPPGFFPYPATPPFQFGRIGRDRRSGPDSAAGVSPGRHFFSGTDRARLGNGAAFMKVLDAGDSQGSRGRKDRQDDVFSSVRPL
ncbi:hypothetical protein NDU88_001552 [Pleurodeles waltl]|uniref:Uncharacterized protein n=1 Tax=Pleurodeles waltl TaxID=8319 RepID=A0AAV7VBC4_PLEWA|nr:hypothetical protein NDU88_001552 [Pleurodeles waltl]